MDCNPIILYPEGVTRPLLNIGSTAIICRSCDTIDQVWKCPLKHGLKGCSDDDIRRIQDDEMFSEGAIVREKIIYRLLPKHPNVLPCFEVAEKGIRFPLLRLGNLRDYLRENHSRVEKETKEKWIRNVLEAIDFIHSFEIVHADISARNFLVADDLSIKLCDFAGSGIGPDAAMVAEEDNYRKSPDLPRSLRTDIFAIGCLIFEIMAGAPPYDGLEPPEIAKRYGTDTFPRCDDLKYGEIILKCWTSQYASTEEILKDFVTKSPLKNDKHGLAVQYLVSGAAVLLLLIFSYAICF